MRDTNKKKSTLAKARNWATKRGLFGAQAFLKYVILSFAENLNRVSDEVVFKDSVFPANIQRNFASRQTWCSLNGWI